MMGAQAYELLGCNRHLLFLKILFSFATLPLILTFKQVRCPRYALFRQPDLNIGLPRFQSWGPGLFCLYRVVRHIVHHNSSASRQDFTELKLEPFLKMVTIHLIMVIDRIRFANKNQRALGKKASLIASMQNNQTLAFPSWRFRWYGLFPWSC